MNLQKKHTLLDDFINNYAEATLSKAELQSFSELLQNDPELRSLARSGVQSRKYLKNLREVKCQPGFDQRMAAKFALELEKDIQIRNCNLLSVAEASN